MGRRDANEEESPSTAPTRGVGVALREARQRRGWTIEFCAQQLRIRPAVLEAMEAGRFEKLTHGAYALGFVRSYADYLGLDRDEIARRVKAEAAALSAPTELVFPTPISESRLPSGVVLAVSALLASAAYGLWYYQTAADRTPIPRVAAVSERMLPTTTDRAAVTNSPAQAEAATVATPGALEAPKPAPAPPSVVVAPTPARPPAAPAESSPQVAAVSPATASAALEAPPLRHYGETAGTRIVLKATGDSWVQVRDRAGTIVFSRILRPGESYGVPDQPGQLLATGSAGVLDILVDGKKAPAIGRPGFTRRDVVLDPERLLAGTAVPPETARPGTPADAPAGPAPTATTDRGG